MSHREGTEMGPREGELGPVSLAAAPGILLRADSRPPGKLPRAQHFDQRSPEKQKPQCVRVHNKEVCCKGFTHTVTEAEMS